MSADSSSTGSARSLFSWWTGMPLYLRILIGLAAGITVGLVLGPGARPLDWPARLILRLLGALAPVLILVAVVHAIMTAEIHGRLALRMGALLLQNTMVAILVGLAVATLLEPGRGADLGVSGTPPAVKGDVIALLLDNIPDSLVGPFVENRVIGVVLIAVAFGIAARSLAGSQRRTADDLVAVGFSCILVVLHWVITLVPLAVFGKVASIVGTGGFRPFVALASFVGAVLVALSIQCAYYLTRIRVQSWVRPRQVFAGLRDALVMAFSTASSTATMPVTYDRLRSRIGLREQSASLGALVGANFNNDGTALYEAMAALFIAQMLGVELGFGQQLMVVLTSVIASVGAAGIPEAGLATMSLVFTAVELPTEYIALLLPVDWFLDRCRTMINVMGDVSVACVLDGRVRGEANTAAESAVAFRTSSHERRRA